jgi:thiol-disulfide isomerase/thioredoxin
MKTNKFFILLAVVMLVSLTHCKKANAEKLAKPVVNTDTTVIKGDSLKSKTEYLQALGGWAPKKELKYFDANITDMKGNPVKLSNYEGKVIFLNLWATWCPPCREEMPSMEKLQKAFEKDDFVILAVSQGEKMSTVQKFLTKKPYSFPIFIDHANEVSSNYATGSIPTSYLIDKKGMLVAQFVGGRDWYSKDSQGLIKLLLAE